MSFLYEYSGFPRRPVAGDPGPFPRFHARLADAERLLSWGVADERTGGDHPPAGPQAPDARRPGDPEG